MAVENRMVIDLPIELGLRNDKEDFDWYFLMYAESSTEYMEYFLELWSMEELYSFMANGSMKREFNKFVAGKAKKAFEADTGLYIDFDYAIKHVEENI